MQENCISDFAEATAVFMLPSFVENVIEDKFSIYPNPATNSINISTDETINHISIFDIISCFCQLLRNFRKKYAVNTGVFG